MKLTEILNRKELSLSFEVFPPKSEDSFSSVKSAIEQIAALKPSFLSVTYGAGGGTSEYTLEIAKSIKEEKGVETLAHLTCVSSDKATVKRQIKNMAKCGVENVLALRGDIPEERKNEDRSLWAYRYAVDLVRDIKEISPETCIGGACYPEVHPESESSRDDILHLKEKTDAGCEFLTTQMFFDNDLLYAFLYKVREAGINVPIVAGIMPITSAKQVERAIKLSGSFMPKRFRSLVDRFGSDETAMKQAGIAYATDQIIDLYANGVTNVHIYTMNKPDVAEKIKKNLTDIIGK
ncbi:MAG: methylenetetrahydrofolate reductase [NAD(P)H] [Clostridia bacterium]|nr:methylenetetrahydrofolate reductase [NAD(P)H] [Clostridia bacterium]